LPKKIAIIIPSFAQNKLLKRCLRSIALQSYKNFEVIIVDDASGNNFDFIATDFKELSVNIIINSSNLGAFNNMLACIFMYTESQFKIVFHEDDIMHPYLLESLLDVFKNNESLFAVGTNMQMFRDNYEFVKQDFIKQDLDVNIYDDKPSLIYDLLNGNHLCFGSIMYRQKMVSKLDKPDVDNYWTLADRPFIISNINKKTFALIKNKLVFYNEHYINDKRSSKLTKDNLFNFFKFYINETKNLDKTKRKYIKSIVAKELLECYHRIEEKTNLIRYLLSAFKFNILSPKYFIYHYFKTK
jgi:glycosyltransferase involved in cell wall biosynthesis